MNERVFRLSAGAATHRTRRPARAGFTLAEMLVAIAIFMVLMSGLLLLFSGSLRTVRSGYQTIDAYEQARGAIAVIHNDLTIAFSASDAAENYNFYGTPIGMTFVGLVRSEDSNTHADLNIGRISYVIYNLNPDNHELMTDEDIFPEALEDGNVNRNGYPYPMLRFVEQGVGDIDSLPLRWDESIDPDDPGGDTPNDVLDALYNEDPRFHGWPENTPVCKDCEDDYRQALRREIWIRVLAGGDAEIDPWPGDEDKGFYFFSPIQWRTDLSPEEIRKIRFSALYKNIKEYLITHEGIAIDEAELRALKQAWWGNYVLANNIISAKTQEERNATADWQNEVERKNAWNRGINFFDYDYTYISPVDVDTDEPRKLDNPWWNDMRSLNCDPLNHEWRLNKPNFNNSKYCYDSCLPAVVSTTFWMMFESPYPGAPDFKRRFCEQVFLPAAYSREQYEE